MFGVLVLALFFTTCYTENDDFRWKNISIVRTKYGFVEGFKFDIGSNLKADIFLGIPFARPPIGNLRFEKPQKVRPWKDVFQAKTWSIPCATDAIMSGNISANSEDCLALNIFRPSILNRQRPPKGGHPVLVWVHGGGYVGGSAKSFGYHNLSTNFISQGIIVVSITYRLGPFGWGSLGDPSMPGNLGYWDMTLALKFLNETIKDFGGNPKRMTVWGLSSGATSVLGLALSPHSRDLVAGTIEQSGSTFKPNNEVVQWTKEWATYLGCNNYNSYLVKACLKSKTFEELFYAMNDTGVTRMDNINFIKYQPVLDYDFFPKRPF